MIALLERLKREGRIGDYEVAPPAAENGSDRVILWVPATVSAADVEAVMQAVLDRARFKGELWEAVFAIALDRQTVGESRRPKPAIQPAAAPTSHVAAYPA